jgi:hypothetical protein
MDCAQISSDILVNCDYPLFTGVKDRLFLFNFSDFEDATLTRNGVNTQIIEDIILASGAVGYTIEGQNNSIMPKQAFVKGTYSSKWDHEVGFIAWSLSPTVKDQVEKLGKGRVVAIVENNYKGDTGNAAYEIYGLDCGLILETAERDPNNQETDGGFQITLKSSERSKEPHLPASVFITDYATTKALVESLV